VTRQNAELVSRWAQNQVLLERQPFLICDCKHLTQHYCYHLHNFLVKVRCNFKDSHHHHV